MVLDKVISEMSFEIHTRMAGTVGGEAGPAKSVQPLVTLRADLLQWRYQTTIDDFAEENGAIWRVASATARCSSARTPLNSNRVCSAREAVFKQLRGESSSNLSVRCA